VRRRVLVLAYYYPPLGGAGVQRTVGFVKRLPELGYDPVVVTGSNASTIHWAPPDEELGREVAADVEVHRIDSREPPRPSGWRARAIRWLRVEDPFVGWWRAGAARLGIEAGRSVDVVYASMSPFETGEAAAAISQRLGKPWVADLRDPWALDEVQVYPTALHRRLEEARMGRVLRTAAAIVMNTPEASAQLIRRFPKLDAASVVTIPNGFDAEDFAGPAPARTDGAFRIVHAGYVHTAGAASPLSVRLGGAVRGYDILTRSHTYLVRALEHVMRERPDLRGKVELHLVGVLSADAEAGLPAGLVHAHGYCSHAETVSLLRSADLLFLPMHDLPPGRRARIVPGKTYEYLATRRPILAAVPDGDARDLLERAGNAVVCRPSDVAGLARAVTQAFDDAASGRRRAEPDERLLAAFDRATLAIGLAGVLDRTIAAGAQASPARPGLVRT
jgi:glycosyltransferase involved in cell wall biosynthesis